MSISESLDRHPYFKAWTDPLSAVRSYVLTERVAPIQKGLYFATPSVSQDGRWLWFNATYPPSRQKHLAVVSLDPLDPLIKVFPQELSGGPLITPEGDSAWVPIHDGIYHLDLNGALTEVTRIPESLIKKRALRGHSTELTISADNRHFLIDCKIGNEWIVLLADITTGRIAHVRTFHRAYQHAAFSPVDPDLFILGQGPGYDDYSGEKTSVIDQRIWLLNRSGSMCEPLFPDLHFGQNSMCCHEWWTTSGSVQWCDYWTGIWEATIAPRERRIVWPHPGLIHGQCHPGLRYLCGDENSYRYNETYPCRLWYYDRQEDREIPVVSGLPHCPIPESDHRSYHIDPHPHFSPDGSLLVHTTGMLDGVDVALTPTAALHEQLASNGHAPGEWDVPGATWSGRD
jgi:hypothetical protein